MAIPMGIRNEKLLSPATVLELVDVSVHLNGDVVGDVVAFYNSAYRDRTATKPMRALLKERHIVGCVDLPEEAT